MDFSGLTACRSIMPVTNSVYLCFRRLSDGILGAGMKLVGAPSIYDLPNLDPKTSEVEINPTFYVAPSFYARKHFMEHNGKTNVAVVHPGVDVSKFLYIEESRASVYEDNDYVVGFLGRVETEKSLGLFIHMMKHLVNTTVCQQINCTFVIVGGGVIPRHLHHLARQLGVAPWLTFRGAVYDDVAGELGQFDVIVNPSLRSTSETFCIVNVEAMAVGVPVISFGSGGVMDYLMDGVNGLLVDERQVTGKGMAKKVLEFWNLPFEGKLSICRCISVICDIRYL